MSRKRKWVFAFLVFATGVALLPNACKFDWVKRQTQLRIERQIGGVCELGSVSFNWFGKQSCHHVKWNHPEKGLKLEADQLIVLESLLDTMRWKENPLHIEIQGASLDLTAGMKWLKKTQKALHIACSPIQATLDHGTISFEKIDLEINEQMQAYTFGKIDLNREDLEITLGLSKQLLAKLFKECRKLPEDFLLEIPIACDLNMQSIQKKLFWSALKNYAIVTSSQR